MYTVCARRGSARKRATAPTAPAGSTNLPSLRSANRDVPKFEVQELVCRMFDISQVSLVEVALASTLRGDCYPLL